MSRITLMLLFTLLAGCATTGPVDPNKYRFLFDNPPLSSSGCVAVFESDGLLYLVSKDYQKNVKMAIYDPKISIFADVTLDYKGTAVCREIKFSALTVLPRGELNFIASQGFRNIFDGYRENPEKLRSVITAGPPYFRNDGKWQGEASTRSLELGRDQISEMRSAEDIARYLKSLDPKIANLSIKSRVASDNADSARRAELQQQFDKAEEQKRQQVQRATETWNNRQTAKYMVGDKICTYDTNLFGYVEEVQKDRVKAQVVGRVALGEFDRKGFFFKSGDGNFEYAPIEGIRWLMRSEIASCNFSGGKVSPGR